MVDDGSLDVRRKGAEVERFAHLFIIETRLIVGKRGVLFYHAVDAGIILGRRACAGSEEYCEAECGRDAFEVSFR
jgi:hypothetical protein